MGYDTPAPVRRRGPHGRAAAHGGIPNSAIVGQIVRKWQSAASPADQRNVEVYIQVGVIQRVGGTATETPAVANRWPAGTSRARAKNRRATERRKATTAPLKSRIISWAKLSNGEVARRNIGIKRDGADRDIQQQCVLDVLLNAEWRFTAAGGAVIAELDRTGMSSNSLLSG